jgi:hypothetical protein
LLFGKVCLRGKERAFGNTRDAVLVSGGSNVNVTAVPPFAIPIRRAGQILNSITSSLVRRQGKQSKGLI